MTDKELADKVVELRVGRYWPDTSPNPRYDMANGYMLATHEAPEFVRDWRVAGALMEKCWSVKTASKGDGWASYALPIGGVKDFEARNESLPRAIIEACVEALS